VIGRFTDKPHDEPLIENYADAAQGSGQALLDALLAFLKRSNHRDLADVLGTGCRIKTIRRPADLH
jgi:hypothetical protein